MVHIAIIGMHAAMASSGKTRPAAGPNNVIDMTNETVAKAPASVWPDSDIVNADPGFLGLNCRKTFKLDEKKRMLEPFVSIEDEAIFSKGMLEGDSLAAKTMRVIRLSGNSKPSRDRQWNQTFVAEMCSSLSRLLKESHAMEKKKSRPPKAVQELLNMVDKAARAHETEEAVASRKTTRSGVIDQRNKRVQDMILFNPSFADPEPCALCNHHVCMPINEAGNVNSSNKRASRNNVANTLQSTKSKDGKKKKSDTGTSQCIACFCCKQMCLCRSDGAGCIVCVGLADNGLMKVDAEKGCLCAVCQCSCSALYPRDKHQAVAQAAAEKKYLGVKANCKSACFVYNM